MGDIGDPVELPFVGLACPEEVRQYDRWELARFLRLQKIGSGFASTVYLCLDTLTNRRLALKTYRKSTLNTAVRESIYMEVAIQGRLCHPNILGLFAAFDDGGYICILSGLAEDSDLYRRLPDIRRDERVIVKHVVGPLLSAVATLHINGVMHRDLKPENILLQGSSLLLADFGFAVCVPRHRPVTRLGTLHFMAPEVILNDPAEGRTIRERVPRKTRLPYDAAVDVWAVGVIVYEVLFRMPPFDGPDEDAVIKDILAAAPGFDGDISPEAYDFLRRCLAYDARDRPTARDLYHHPWVTQHMPEDKWELLLPDNFATLESAGRSIEMLGDYVRGAGERRTTDGVHAQDGGQDGEQPVRRFRKHAGSLGVSEHAYDSGDSARPQAGAVQRRREKAVHSQFMMADGAVSVAGSRAGSMTGPNGLQAALAAQQRAFAGVRRSGEGGRRQGSFSGNGVRRSTDMVERSAGSLPHMQFQVASWHGKRVVAGRVPSGVSPGRSGMGGAIDSGHGPRGPTKSRQSRLGIAPDAGGSSRRHHTEPDAPTATARDSVDQAQPGTYARPAGMDMGVGAIPEGEGSIVEEDGERATRGGSMSARVRSRDKGSGQQETGETEAAPGRSAGQKVRWWRWRERSAAREG